jgi:hypothetical protein
MKIKALFLPLAFLIVMVTIISCKQPEKTVLAADNVSNVNGTWSLLSSKIITKGDTAVTFPFGGQEMIKIINDTHFAFFKHDTNKGKGPGAVFDSGGGTYTLINGKYTEHLQYCSYREWEDHKFDFTLELRNDTLIQKGIERIDSLGVNREILEIYVRKK